MVPASLLVISRSQSLARRLQEEVGADEVRARWQPSSRLAEATELVPAVVILELPESGGKRAIARLRRRFEAPLLVLQRHPGQPMPDGIESSVLLFPDGSQLAQAVKEALHRSAPGIRRVGELSLDIQNRRLQVGGQFHQLRPIGCQILALLMDAPGRTLVREELFRRVWNTEDGDSTRALDVHVSHLRRVIERDPRRPRVLVTERGLGYRLETNGHP